MSTSQGIPSDKSINLFLLPRLHNVQPPALVAGGGLILALGRSRLRRVDQDLNYHGVACLFGFSESDGSDPGVV
jgi:hypothetical protein